MRTERIHFFLYWTMARLTDSPFLKSLLSAFEKPKLPSFSMSVITGWDYVRYLQRPGVTQTWVLSMCSGGGVQLFWLNSFQSVLCSAVARSENSQSPYHGQKFNQMRYHAAAFDSVLTAPCDGYHTNSSLWMKHLRQNRVYVSIRSKLSFPTWLIISVLLN